MIQNETGRQKRERLRRELQAELRRPVVPGGSLEASERRELAERVRRAKVDQASLRPAGKPG